MAEGTTLLSYEMGWQLRLFDLMAASQQAGDYIMACTYGIALLEILGLENIPQREVAKTKAGSDELATWQNFYRDILMVGIGKIRNTINVVRKNYKPSMDIPKYSQKQAVAT